MKKFFAISGASVLIASGIAVAFAQAIPSSEPISWNTNEKVNLNGSRTAEIHLKWVNYHDGSKWNKIDLKPKLSGDEFVMDKAPYEVRMPKFADGLMTVTNNNKWDKDAKAIIQDAPISMMKTWIGASHVQGITDGNDIVYAGALSEGDIIYQLHEQEVRSLVRINAQPSGISDVRLRFRETFTDNLSPKKRNGASVKATQEDVSDGFKVSKSSSREIFTRRAIAWDSSTPSKRIQIQLPCSMGASVLSCEKVIPRSFLATATYPVFTDTTTSFYAGSGDGYVGNSGLVWAVARAASTGDSYDYTTAWHDNQFQTYKTGATYILWRAFYPADTSAIGSTNTVTAATLNVWCETKTPDSDAVSWHIVETTQASTTSLATSDFGSIVNTSLGSRTVAGMTTGAYTAYTLSDLTKINKTGTTKLGLISSLDLNNSAPTGANYWVSMFSEYTGTDNDPYYSVTYSPTPAVAKPVIIIKVFEYLIPFAYAR